MKYFGTDGFRGRANETLTAIHAFRAGRFLGHYYGRGRRARIVLGKDTRLSSYCFEYAFAAGAAASGADVFLLHVTTTPSVAFVVRTEGFDCGAMISASHNCYLDNGIKLFGGDGEKLSEEVLLLLEEYLDGGTLPLATGADIGRTVDYAAGRNRYLACLLSLPRASFRGLRVGLDCANGSAWSLAKTVFDALGAQVRCLGVSPDGTNINAGCGSTRPEGLCELVRLHSLDMGFAFDGDADRCIAVDERGEIVNGDGILYLCAREMAERGELGAGVVTTVLSNGGLLRALERMGVVCTRTQVGDKFVAGEMARRGALLGGEPSGHIIFRKHASTGDGILTALKTAEIVAEKKCPLSVLLRGYSPLPQRACNVAVGGGAALVAGDGVQRAVREAEKAGVRMVVRPSGTEEVVRVLAEGEETAAEEAVRRVERSLRESAEAL